MSYNVYLEVDAGGPETVEAYWRNHTSNTAVMWREAGCDLAEFHGRLAADLGGALTPALADMRARSEHYAQWNPPNGWGSVDSTIAFLTELRAACDRFPLAKVVVSR